MTDRTAAIANLIREYRSADRADLLRAIFLRWPDLTSDELDRAINHRPSGRRLLVLPQAHNLRKTA